MATPASTYRLQIRAGFDLYRAAELTDYLRALGVDWAYLSPLLQATSGSDHGYDVTDPTRVDPERGGAAGLEVFAHAARADGLGILIDIVPNHQGVSAPAENPWWWDVLRRGEQSPHAAAFDIDWAFGDGRVLVPVLGAPLEEVLAAGDITLDPTASDQAPDGVARYFEHTLPLAPGTAPAGATSDADAVAEVLRRQHWRWAFWRREHQELDYRRFFAVTTLAGVRVELPAVFDATHAEVLRWFRDGFADGLRIDHPDGLADPGGYLDRLQAALADAGAPDAPVLVEKILEHGEALPDWWATAGTTGYDAMAVIDRVLTDPAGQAGLDGQLADAAWPSWPELIHDTKRAVADGIQAAEVQRIVRLLAAASDGAPALPADAETTDAVAELLTNFPVYRAYLPAGAAHLAHALDETQRRRPELSDRAAAVVARVSDAGSEVSHRFMQTTGPVMAKGVEDCAFYRFNRLGSLTEVGADPSQFALDVDGFHAAQLARQSAWPAAMTSLSTHDTKRSEDVRARLAVLAEVPERWTSILADLRHIASTGHGPTDVLLWQAVVGSWPASLERLHAYAEKAVREAGERTSWTDPDETFEAAVHALIDASHTVARPLVDGFVAEIVDAGRRTSLSAKLLQLAGPGVPDVYQGSELWDLSLVDPDNRRPVDFDLRRGFLARIDDGWQPPIDETGAAKLHVVAQTLRARRDRPELFTGYRPVSVVGEAAEHAIAFDRGGALAVATRLPMGLAHRGGWGDTLLLRAQHPVVDAFTGRRYAGGAVPMAALLADYPVALLLPEEAAPARAARTEEDA